MEYVLAEGAGLSIADGFQSSWAHEVFVALVRSREEAAAACMVPRDAHRNPVLVDINAIIVSATGRAAQRQAEAIEVGIAYVAEALRSWGRRWGRWRRRWLGWRRRGWGWGWRRRQWRAGGPWRAEWTGWCGRVGRRLIEDERVLHDRAHVKELDSLDVDRALRDTCSIGHTGSPMQVVIESKPRSGERLLVEWHEVNVGVHVEPVVHHPVGWWGAIDGEAIAHCVGVASSSVEGAHKAVVPRAFAGSHRGRQRRR